MTKYELFGTFLKDFNGNYYKGTFEEIEKIIGDKLSPVAYDDDRFWRNKRYGLMKNANIAGWEQTGYDLGKKEVEFERTNLTSFQKLQNYLSYKINPQVNYQPVLIKTLVKMGGRSPKNIVAEQIKLSNPNYPDQDYKQILLDEVSTKKKIFREESNQYLLRGYDDLTEEQKLWIIETCESRIKEFSSHLEENFDESLKSPEKNQLGKKFIDNGDFNKFLNAVPLISTFQSSTGIPPMSSEDYQILYRVLYGTALRHIEVLKLKKRDINLKKREIYVGGSKATNYPATILPCDVPYLEKYISKLNENDLLFKGVRSNIWRYAQMAGIRAGIKIKVEKKQITREKLYSSLLRESRAHQMWMDRADDDLIALKLRTNPPNSKYKDSPPTIEQLKIWEEEKYPLDYSEIDSTSSDSHADGWAVDIEKAIDEILGANTMDELALDRVVVKRTIRHLKSGKHVILVGPPGVGKTKLAKRISQVIGKKIIGVNPVVESIASEEWSRYEVIGGIDHEGNFQQGVVAKAALENKWLIIDEFNRANMNKAFGEMFLGIEYGKIKLRPPESKIFRDVIILPEKFRMICTMNDFDKNLLLTELSYGLINRFAFVQVTADTTKERHAVENKIKKDLRLPNTDVNFQTCKDQIDTYYGFINDVRIQRNIGVRTSIDVIKYLITAALESSNSESLWNSLNDALCDYVLPQFDRLDRETIEFVLERANQHLKNDKFNTFLKELQLSLDRLRKATIWLDRKD